MNTMVPDAKKTTLFAHRSLSWRGVMWISNLTSCAIDATGRARRVEVKERGLVGLAGIAKHGECINILA